MENSTLSIYKASAGSGKTFTLTVEYIYLMIRPQAEEEYLHTLAVTFTNKATAEMKDRILQHLYGIWKHLRSSKGYLQALQKKFCENGIAMGEEEIRRRCGESLSMILHDYSRFRVETIDSFFQSILRTLARELEKSPNLQVNLNDKELVSQAVDRIIENLHEDSKMQRVVMEYINNRLDDTGKWNVTSSLKDFSRHIFGEDFCQRTDEERKILSDYQKVSAFQTDMRKIRNDAQEQIKAAVQEILNRYEASGVGEYMRYKVPFTYLQKVLLNVSEKRPDKLQSYVDDPTTMLLAKFKSNESVVSKLQELMSLFREFMKFEDKMRPLVNTASLAEKYTYPLQLLNRVDEEVRLLNEENESFSLSKTPTLLSRLIQNSDSPFVFEKIGTVLRNIMIDEFQDTSRLQWDNFRVLLFENQSLGGSDLVVGDIKQSIYRWRGGYWNLLLNLANNMQLWSPREKTLETNYRSDVEVIDFNNKLYKSAASALDSLDSEARFKLSDIYADVEQKWPEGKERKGYVRTALYLKGKKNGGLSEEDIKETMLEEMLQKIVFLHEQGLPLEEMAILVRVNKSIPAILEYFHKNAPEGIAITSDEAFLLSNSPLVNFIITTLRMLTTDAEMNQVPLREFLATYHLDVIHSGKTLDEIMCGAPEELLPAALVEQKERLVQLPVYELVEELFSMLHMENFKNQEAYHFAFLDIIQAHLQDNPSDINSFLQEWDAHYYDTAIPAGRVEGVRILSIHKSKGLEFHTVFLPFCDWDIESDTKTTILWCEADNEHPNFNVLGRLPVKKDSKMAGSYYRAYYQEEHLQCRVDELNALYVATTRAGRNLFIWAGTDGTLTTRSTVGDLIRESLGVKKEDFQNSCYTLELGAPVIEVKDKEKSDNRMLPDYEGLDIPVYSYSARLNFKQSNDAKKFFATEPSVVFERIDMGNLYHSIFSMLENYNQIELVLRKAISDGLINQEQATVLRDYLNQIPDNPLVRSWFDPANKVFNECAILNPQGKEHEDRNLRPDRVVMNGDTITVVDYKFGQPNRKYAFQVRAYMNLMKSMYPTHDVKGYLWYVPTGKIDNV